jgi:tripartite-type tricarboxylate transporter receptor subunit TctC
MAACGSIGLLARRAARASGGYPLLEGKTVRILVGSEVGGKFDLFARSVGRHFEREIAGLRVEIQNMPQASGALAAKALQDGPGDGTMLFTSSSGLLSAQVQGDESVAYDLAKWQWLGSLATEARLLVSGPGADFSGLDELRAKSAPSPASVRSTKSYAYHEALWVNALVGTRIKPVPGFKSVEKEAAVAHGEVMLTVIGYPTDAAILDSPGVDVVLRLADGPDLPERFRDRPRLADLVAANPSVARVAHFMDVSTSVLNWMAAPPATEPQVLAEWRRAFAAAATSTSYLDEAAKLNFTTALVEGAELGDRIGAIFSDVGPLRTQLANLAACGSALAEGAAGGCAAT